MKKGCMIVLAIVLVIVVAGCGSSRKVTRIDSATVTDVSGKWNDTDARLVAEEMITDCVSRVWVADFAAATGGKPVVTIGAIGNKSSEHIDTEIFTADFERELINSGKIRFVASKGQRDELRGERFDQEAWASAETMKKIRAETGADFMLLGSIKSIVDQAEGIQVKFYQTDLEMINIETMEKVWIGSKKIKKEISKNPTKW